MYYYNIVFSVRICKEICIGQLAISLYARYLNAFNISEAYQKYKGNNATISLNKKHFLRKT